MENKLTQEEKAGLEAQHKKTRDRRIADRIKAVLWADEGLSYSQIGKLLLVHPETVRVQVRTWHREKRLKPNNGGSKSHLSTEETECLKTHLESRVYTRVDAICAYVKQQYQISYTRSGMTKWLKHNGFRYKQPKAIPAKANREAQAQFIEAYQTLKTTLPSDEPIFFMDAVHPTMATKVSYGWIKKGKAQPINQSASRTRVKLIGAIAIGGKQPFIQMVETVNANSICQFLNALKQEYSEAKKLHIMLDQSGYHRSQQVRAFAEKESIILHYLPPYSPNLNPIERLWKLMNEQVRNNRFFASPQRFKEAIMQFFEKQLPLLTHLLQTRITDNFQTLPSVS